MRKILHLMLLLSITSVFTLQAFAQEKTVTGKVVGENDQPLSGVTIRVKGTNRFVQTDAAGNYRIQAKEGETLEFSHVGFETIQSKVGKGDVNISINLRPSDNTLGEVTVVMDIKRNARELGYSVQKVTGKEVAETQRENFVNGLQGRVAGLTINPTNGQAGSSSSIVLRGFNSMALDNQPLFIVDGIIVDNQTMNETSGQGIFLGLASDKPNRQNDYTNRIADLNPNDIESITVLKGPEATALYGSQASSGAIVITTKKGKANNKIAINYDNAFRAQILNRFPDHTDKFNSGDNGVFNTIFRYFGPEYTDTIKRHDNIRNFFRTGFSQTHNLSAEFGKKNYTFRFSGSFFDQDGVVPHNHYNKYTLKVSNTTKLGKYIDVSPSLSYIHSNSDKPLRGASGYLLTLLVWPVTDDATNFLDANNSKRMLYTSSPNSELDNPFFNVRYNRSQDETNRLLATFGININPFTWLSVAGRFGYDTYRTEGFTLYHPFSFYLTKGQGGSLDNYYRDYYGYNHTINVTAKKTVGKFSTRLMVGTMWQDYKTTQYAVSGTNIVDSVNTAGEMVKGGQVVTQDQFLALVGSPADSNSTRPTTRTRLNNARKGLYNLFQNRQVAYFGEAAISFKNMIFLSYSHRFETSSIFPKAFRNYNYPAGSLSMILSDLLPVLKKGKVIDYAKLRLSLASTARSSLPYANQSVFGVVTSSGGGYAYGFTNNNFFLEPETQQTYEIGTEWRLFTGRLNFEVTYYNTLCEKQIAENFRSSYATGYVLNTLNVGSTRNQGVEMSIDANLMRKSDFNWNIRFNLNHMWNKVLSLPPNVPEFYISDTWLYGNARGGLITGGPSTAITAAGYQRNNAGAILINPGNGLPIIDPLFKVRGDRNPDFTLGTVNTMRYKNWNLSFLWDLRMGGDVFNGTDLYLTLNGKSLKTENRKTPIVVDGVLNDGLQNTATPTKNTITITPYYLQSYYTTMPEEEFIEHDINWLRLRDVTLSYSFPAQKIKRLHYFKSLGFFFTANDLILITNYTGADPATNGNTAGTRGVGGWGFDYGNIATPVSLNFGVRAGF